MKRCELCNSPARMHCESDKASLCWNCDSKVHGANFLVARHCRSLLCHVCQCPTPWSASGTEFGPTVSVCRRCVREGAEKIGIGDACEESEGGNEADIDRSGNEADIDSEDKLSMNKDEEEVADSDEADDDRDGDQQVVPWSSTASPPPATSSSTDEEYSSRKLPVESDGDSPITSLKRSRESSSDLRLQEDLEPWNKRRNTVTSLR